MQLIFIIIALLLLLQPRALLALGCLIPLGFIVSKKIERVR